MNSHEKSTLNFDPNVRLRLTIALLAVKNGRRAVSDRERVGVLISNDPPTIVVFVCSRCDCICVSSRHRASYMIS